MPSWVCGCPGGMRAVTDALMGMWLFRGHEGSDICPHGYVVVQGA